MQDDETDREVHGSDVAAIIRDLFFSVRFACRSSGCAISPKRPVGFSVTSTADRVTRGRVLVEAELKAVVRDVNAVSAALGRRASAHKSTYADRYFDYPDRRLTEQGRELRVRTISDNSGRTRVLLTYKEPALDDDSGSKPEHETTVENADILVTVLTALGVEEFIAFRKNCVNYRFTALERDLLATLVTVPELENQTFIELETMAEADDLNAALDVVRSVLRELGISEQDLTVETYTDAITAQRTPRRLPVHAPGAH